MSERKRSRNWQLPEKMLLVDLVTEHFHIIENKRTDAVTMKQKCAEWFKISERYNSRTSYCTRTADNLKAQWESLKKATKKDASTTRQNMMQTGGGPAKPKNNDPFLNRIMGLISTSVVGLYNPFDNDGTNIQTVVVIEDLPNNKTACVTPVEFKSILSPKVSSPIPIILNLDLEHINDDVQGNSNAVTNFISYIKLILSF